MVINGVDVRGGGVANVLVWVEGIASGKPLPEVRRETLTIDHCQFQPRVLAVATRTTINVFSMDRAVHHERFIREGEEVVDSVHTVDDGQVVPSERIADKPGIVEVRCALHPWERGYVAVFSQPYFAVTDEGGNFRIDGLAPGTYTMKLWHPRLSVPIERQVVIVAGGTGRLDVALPLQ
jgi:hypothetical protein